MKRGNIVFVTAVFTALLTGILVARSGDEPRRLPEDVHELAVVEFPELVAPWGPHELRGGVRFDDRGPAPGVAVHLYQESPGEVAAPLAWDTTNAQGHFTIAGLRAGTYQVALVKPGYPIGRNSVVIPAPAGPLWQLEPHIDPLPALPDMRRSVLTGRVARIEGSVASEIEGYAVLFLPRAGTANFEGVVRRTVLTDADGKFGIDDLVEGDYDVHVLPPWAVGGSWPVLARSRVEHRAGRPPLDLRLETGSFVGRLYDLDGRPIEGALVLVHPFEESTRLFPPRATNVNGVFRAQDLPPGRYRVELRAGSARLTVEGEIEAGSLTELDLARVNPARSDG